MSPVRPNGRTFGTFDPGARMLSRSRFPVADVEQAAEALRRGVVVLENAVTAYGVPWRTAEKLQALHDEFAALLDGHEGRDSA